MQDIHTPLIEVRSARRVTGYAAVCSEDDLVALLRDGSGTEAADGLTLAVYFPPDTPRSVRDSLHDQIADLLSRTRRAHGPQLVWQPGNPLDLPG
ncbi:hypothetical protein [Streptacidiphilus sp. MAP5-3]|uniref:hypothetical protein n=1 Tax=unclassified Streptacidiphilus TaxID=2643834 RepID=UPI00351801F5